MNYAFTDARCEPTPITYLNEKREAFKTVLEHLIVLIEITSQDFRIDRNKLKKISDRLYQRLNYYLFFHGKHLAQSRQAGITAYWILRYCPLTLITLTAWKRKYDINAYFAFFYILYVILGELIAKQPRGVQRAVVKKVLTDYENVFMRAFSEYDISKEAMMLVTDNIKNICRYEIELHTKNTAA